MSVPVPALPPAGPGIYVHIPWCIRKCPYCDFNSHALHGAIDEPAYTAALLVDLAAQAAGAEGGPAGSIFFGGGTPSLYPAAGVARVIESAADLPGLLPDAEITLEANPGAADAARFAAYRAAGVSRLSIGVQSFDNGQLAALGRIHDAGAARAAFTAARAAGFDNVNLDLMYGLPGQTVAQAMADLDAALALGPEHLSWYQLTLEPNTPFHHAPPQLPPEDCLWDMAEAGRVRLLDAGYRQVEISAWARPGRECRHNLNYWRFGDYFGIGAGAHAKLSGPTGVRRLTRERHPQRYLADPCGGRMRTLSGAELPVEFMLNALRLELGVETDLFEARTGLPPASIGPQLARARRRGLLEAAPQRLCASDLGRRFLNDTLALFEPD